MTVVLFDCVDKNGLTGAATAKVHAPLDRAATHVRVPCVGVG